MIRPEFMKIAAGSRAHQPGSNSKLPSGRYDG
jgi:hypothetical protein